MNSKRNLNNINGEISGQTEPIFNYLVWVLNRWYAKFSEYLSYNLRHNIFSITRKFGGLRVLGLILKLYSTRN